MDKAPDEICSSCGKIISLRAIAHLVGDSIVCNNCKKKIDRVDERTNRLPTPGQMSFLEKLGFKDFEGASFDVASKTIDLAQKVRYFAFQVAQQEFKWDLFGSDLKLLIQYVFAQGDMIHEIEDVMNWVEAEKMRRQHEYQAVHNDYISPVECVPDLKKDKNYKLVRDVLAGLKERRLL